MDLDDSVTMTTDDGMHELDDTKCYETESSAISVHGGDAIEKESNLQVLATDMMRKDPWKRKSM